MSLKKGVAKSGLLARSATEARNYSVIMKVLRIVLASLTVFAVLIYIVSVMYTKFGSYTVTINKFDSINYGLTLCETPDFVDPSIRLNAKACENVTNISVEWLPEDLDNINGSHNGDNYLAYTYYCKNVGQLELTYEYYLYIANVTNNVDTAVRFRLYVDGEPATYARTSTDGSGAEPNTTEFLTNSGVCRAQISDFMPGDVTKFTVVIWVEGDDPDCVDDLLGGSLKSDMSISVVNVVYPDEDI